MYNKFVLCFCQACTLNQDASYNQEKEKEENVEIKRQGIMLIIKFCLTMLYICKYYAIEAC